MVAHGKVYDATSTVPHHPGGPDSILNKAGQDCTRDYDMHPKPGQKAWTDSHIGWVEPDKKDKGCNIM